MNKEYYYQIDELDNDGGMVMTVCDKEYYHEHNDIDESLPETAEIVRIGDQLGIDFNYCGNATFAYNCEDIELEDILNHLEMNGFTMTYQEF